MGSSYYLSLFIIHLDLVLHGRAHCPVAPQTEELYILFTNEDMIPMEQALYSSRIPDRPISLMFATHIRTSLCFSRSSTFKNVVQNPIGLKKVSTGVASLRIGHSNRHHSSIPPFNSNSTFQHVSQPVPNWKVGDGLSNPSAEPTTSARKTWDFSKLENAR